MCGNCEIIQPTPETTVEKIAVSRVFSQAEFMDVKHTFKDGIYTRTGKIAAGEIIIGTKHRAKNILHIAKGKIAVWDNLNGFRVLTAPHSEISLPGIQRVGIGIEDTEGSNIFETDKTTVEEVENEMLFPLTLPENLAENLAGLLKIQNENQFKQIA